MHFYQKSIAPSSTKVLVEVRVTVAHPKSMSEPRNKALVGFPDRRYFCPQIVEDEKMKSLDKKPDSRRQTTLRCFLCTQTGLGSGLQTTANLNS
jgi:hypothetical protein